MTDAESLAIAWRVAFEGAQGKIEELEAQVERLRGQVFTPDELEAIEGCAFFTYTMDPELDGLPNLAAKARAILEEIDG